LRNPTFSVPRTPQSPTLLGSNLGTKFYVLRSLWNLLLSNLRLFSLGHTLNPRFLSLGNTRRVPVTRPPGTTSRSNSPCYPRRGALPHAGDYSTLTEQHVLCTFLINTSLFAPSKTVKPLAARCAHLCSTPEPYTQHSGVRFSHKQHLHLPFTPPKNPLSSWYITKISLSTRTFLVVFTYMLPPIHCGRRRRRRTSPN